MENKYVARVIFLWFLKAVHIRHDQRFCVQKNCTSLFLIRDTGIPMQTDHRKTVMCLTGLKAKI